MNTPKGFQAVIEHFQQNGWRFERDDNRLLLNAWFRGKNGTFNTAVRVDASDDLFQVASFLPVVVPVGSLHCVADFCARTSLGLKLGGFEVDGRERVVRFRVAAPYPKGEPSMEVIRRAISVTIVQLDAFLPALMSIIFSPSPLFQPSQASAGGPLPPGVQGLAPGQPRIVFS